MKETSLKGLKAGDKIKLKSSSQEYTGSYLPSEDSSLIILKLENGYNMGISRSTVTAIQVLDTKKSQPKKPSQTKPLRKDDSLPTISILHTGGTIASKVDYSTGAVTADFSPQELLDMVPELSTVANMKSRLVRQMMSENMRFAHYNLLAKEVKKELDSGVKGIIITHGTDTMHYTSAALAFALENISIPVILVGAQRSSDRGSSDAALNLLSAAYFIANHDFSGVAVCMHENLHDNSCLVIDGVKVKKMHTSRRDAFRPINASAYARVNVSKKLIEPLMPPRNKPVENFSLKPFKENLRIGILKAHTNMYAEEFSCYKAFNGLVIEGTALGQLPTAEVDEFTYEHNRIQEVLQQLTASMPVVMASQCPYGRVDMNVYSEGRKNIRSGVLGNYSDMTSETTFIKLAWLLSNHPKHVHELITKNLRGELSTRLEEHNYLN